MADFLTRGSLLPRLLFIILLAGSIVHPSASYMQSSDLRSLVISPSQLHLCLCLLPLLFPPCLPPPVPSLQLSLSILFGFFPLLCLCVLLPPHLTFSVAFPGVSPHTVSEDLPLFSCSPQHSPEHTETIHLFLHHFCLSTVNLMRSKTVPQASLYLETSTLPGI